jgi:hypothetical protein
MCMFCRSLFVCSSSIYGFWLPHWYLHTLLIEVPVPGKKSERWCICVLRVSSWPLSTRARLAQLVRQLDYLRTHTSLSPIRRGFAPGFVNYKKGALDSQAQVIKFTSCLPMVGGSLRVLRLLPPLKLVANDIAEILLKVALKHQKSIK